MTNEATEATPPILDHIQVARNKAVETAATCLRGGAGFAGRGDAGDVDDIIDLAEYIVSGDPYDVNSAERKIDQMRQMHDLRVQEDLDHPMKSAPADMASPFNIPGMDDAVGFLIDLNNPSSMDGLPPFIRDIFQGGVPGQRKSED